MSREAAAADRSREAARPVTVDHVNTLLTGGAALAARRIHEGLLAAGVDSRFWHRDREALPADVAAGQPISIDGQPAYRPLPWPAPASFVPGLGAVQNAWTRWRGKRTLQRALAGRPPGLDLFSTATNGYTPLGPRLLGGDLLHLHWLAWWIDYPSFFASIPDDFPVVWSLHDMNPFTGGCHYTGNCPAFRGECRECPQLGSPGPADLARQMQAIKAAALATKRLHIVAASQWLERAARESRILQSARSFRTIHYGLDTQKLAPIDKLVARDHLSLPRERTIVVFGAEDIHNARKGLLPLLEALSRLRGRERVLGVFFGRGSVTASPSLPELRSLGFIADPVRQQQLYSAADLLVMPSLQENLGQVGLEAMACGTPVVAFDAGGNADFVRPGVSGLLARPGDADDLAAHMQRLIDDDDLRRRLGAAARAMIEREFSVSTMVEAYRGLYAEILSEPPSGCVTTDPAT